MAVAYIDAGSKPTAVQMNALFAEADARLSSLLSGKSFLLCPPASGGWDGVSWVGKFFFFTQGLCAYAWQFPGAWNKSTDDIYKVQPYSQTVFDEALLATAVESYDDANLIANLGDIPSTYLSRIGLSTGDSNALLNASLKANTVLHDGKTYFCKGKNQEFPERIYRYAQAEIVIDGTATGAVIDAGWNKYNFFRCHNLTRSAVTVQFGADHTLTIEPLASQCVRRSGVGGTYTDGWTYFQRFENGDPRFFREYNPGAGLLVSPALDSHRSNNVHSPAVLIDVIKAFCGQHSNALFKLDQNEFCDITAQAIAYFANPDDIDALVGDLIHHRGTVQVAKISGGVATITEATFAGHARLATVLAPLGVSVTEAGSGNQKLQTSDGITTDIIFTGTNFAKSGETCAAILNVDSGVELEAFGSSLAVDIWPVQKVTSEGYSVLQYVDADTANVGPLHKAKAKDLIALKSVYSASHSGALSNDWSVVSNADAAYSPLGLTLIGTHTITPRFPLSIPATADYKVVGATLVRDYAMTLTGQGWGKLDSSSVLAFNAPWDKRYYGACDGDALAGAKSNDHTNETQGPAGDDFKTVNNLAYSSTTIFRLDPVSQIMPRGTGARFRLFSNPDVLKYFTEHKSNYASDRNWLLAGTEPGGAVPTGFLRLQLLSEHYNALAGLVNSATLGKVLAPEAVLVVVSDGLGGYTTQGIAKNAVGLVGTSKRPKDQFARLTTQQQIDAAGILGIPLKSMSDFPASWTTLLGTGETQRTFTTRFTATLTGKSATTIHDDFGDNPGFIFDASYRYSSTSSESVATGARLVDAQLQDIFGNSGASGLDTNYTWISIDDAQTAFESLGLTWAFFDHTEPLELKIYNVGGGFSLDAGTVRTASGKYGWPSYKGTLNNGTTTLEASTVTPGNYARFVASMDASTAEWVQDIDTASSNRNDFPPTVLDTGATFALRVEVPFGELWTQDGGVWRFNAYGGLAQLALSMDANFLAQQWGTKATTLLRASISDASETPMQALKIPCHYFTYDRGGNVSTNGIGEGLSPVAVDVSSSETLIKVDSGDSAKRYQLYVSDYEYLSLL